MDSNNYTSSDITDYMKDLNDYGSVTQEMKDAYESYKAAVDAEEKRVRETEEKFNLLATSKVIPFTSFDQIDVLLTHLESDEGGTIQVVASTHKKGDNLASMLRREVPQDLLRNVKIEVKVDKNLF